MNNNKKNNDKEKNENFVFTDCDALEIEFPTENCYLSKCTSVWRIGFSHTEIAKTSGKKRKAETSTDRKLFVLNLNFLELSLIIKWKKYYGLRINGQKINEFSNKFWENDRSRRRKGNSPFRLARATYSFVDKKIGKSPIEAMSMSVGCLCQ